MTYIGSKEYFFEISQGNVGSLKSLVLHGHNSDVDSGAAEDIWGAGGQLVPLPSAETMNIVSTSTNDDGSPVGTGARTVEVTGLNGSHALTTETVTMNGTTNVLTANSYLYIRSLRVLTAGSTNSNVGMITVKASTAATIQSSIHAAQGMSHGSQYVVPASTTAYIAGTQLWGSTSGTAPLLDYELHCTKSGVQSTLWHGPIDAALESYVPIPYIVYEPISAQSLLYYEVSTDQDNAVIHSQMYIVEVT